MSMKNTIYYDKEHGLHVYFIAGTTAIYRQSRSLELFYMPDFQIQYEDEFSGSRQFKMFLDPLILKALPSIIEFENGIAESHTESATGQAAPPAPGEPIYDGEDNELHIAPAPQQPRGCNTCRFLDGQCPRGCLDMPVDNDALDIPIPGDYDFPPTDNNAEKEQ